MNKTIQDRKKNNKEMHIRYSLDFFRKAGFKPPFRFRKNLLVPNPNWVTSYTYTGSISHTFGKFLFGKKPKLQMIRFRFLCWTRHLRRKGKKHSPSSESNEAKLRQTKKARSSTVYDDITALPTNLILHPNRQKWLRISTSLYKLSCF